MTNTSKITGMEPALSVMEFDEHVKTHHAWFYHGQIRSHRVLALVEQLEVYPIPANIVELACEYHCVREGWKINRKLLRAYIRHRCTNYDKLVRSSDYLQKGEIRFLKHKVYEALKSSTWELFQRHPGIARR